MISVHLMGRNQDLFETVEDKEFIVATSSVMKHYHRFSTPSCSGGYVKYNLTLIVQGSPGRMLFSDNEQGEERKIIDKPRIPLLIPVAYYATGIQQ